MDTEAEPGREHQQEPAGQSPATHTVPLRPRRLAGLARPPPDEQQRPRQALGEGLPDGPLAGPGPFLCYLTIDGLDRTDPGELIRLRGRVHAAARTAAEGCQTTCHARCCIRDGSGWRTSNSLHDQLTVSGIAASLADGPGLRGPLAENGHRSGDGFSPWWWARQVRCGAGLHAVED